MNTQIFTAEYWNERYLQNNHPWDIGHSSTPLKEFIKKLGDKKLKVLIPGAGNGYEAAFMHQEGFEHVILLDWAEKATERFKDSQPDFPAAHVLCENFFEHEGKYDLILEQTFFCALPPAMRPDYLRKMHELLLPGGRLAGLLFNFPLTEKGPPFGGEIEAYKSLFSTFFTVKVLESCRNSIQPRAGSELFFILEKEK